MSFWSSLKDTAESIGGATLAPFGVVYDLATTPFDDKDDNFGTVAAKVASRTSALADPFFNEQTWSGAAFGKTMRALDTVYREGISEPMVTAQTMAGHAMHSPENVGDIFSGDKWAEAYATAQNRSIGQAAVVSSASFFRGAGLDSHAGLVDPLDERAYKQINKATPITSTLASGTTDFIARWYLDPGIIVGKGAKVAKAGLQTRKLTMADRLDLADKMADAKAKTLGVPRFVHESRDIGTRTEKYLDWIGDKEASSIFHGTPELRTSGQGQAIAGLLADANKIEDGLGRRDAQRRILAVAAGDDTQIRRLQDEISEAPAIVDALKNMRRGTTLELKTQALVPSAKANPAFIASLEKQLDNLNTDDKISDFVQQHQARLDLMLQTERTLDNLPGVHQAGKRAVKRDEGTGLLREGPEFTQKAMQKARDFADRPSAQTAFQKSVHHAPLLVLKTLEHGSSPWTKAPRKAVDAMRQQHFQGVVNLHDWNGATGQLDSMMRIAGVDTGTRLKTLSEAYLLRANGDEASKMKLIDRVESQALKSLWARFGEKVDNPDDLAHGEFFEQLMLNGSRTRSQQLSQLRGRMYAATEMPDSMLATRGKGMQAAQDAARGGAGKWKPRVDMIDDHGTPVALPLFETQLANSVPLFDINLAKKLVKRDAGHMSRLARAWKADAHELGHLERLKAAGGKGLEKAIEARRAAMDWSIHLGQVSMRAWKFGVLFRLGYPVRVLMDDHMRIWTQMNAMTFYGDNGKQALSNLAYNQVGRRRQTAQFIREAKIQRRELLDKLDGNFSEVYANRASEIARLNRSVGATQAKITKWKQRLEEAETKQSLGFDNTSNIAALKKNIAEAEDLIREKRGAADYLTEQLGDSPDEIKAAIAGLEERLDQGRKAFAPDKRKIGEQDIDLGDGLKAKGAFGGGYGAAHRESTRSSATFDLQMEGAEDRQFRAHMRGSFRTIQPNEAGHLDAWADVLNHQFAMSRVAKHFLKGGSVEEFARKVNSAEWADLRERLGHYAHDPEDWGHRVQELVRDYLPTDELRQLALDGKVRPRHLRKLFPTIDDRPAVHGNIAAYNLGDVSGAAQMMGKGLNRIYKFLGEMPTDRLSRHPFFNSMYKQHIVSLHEEALTAAKAKGLQYGQKDIERLESVARRRALADLKRTLFDISAHSHAAHVMRFVSPFFAAHQESLSRWWRIVSDDPSIVRKFQLAFDMPRKVGLVYNSETGEPVKPGEAISTEHRIMLRLPEAWGGKTFEESDFKWSVNENSFNLVLQGGLMNPGAGPLVTVPVEAITKKYADEPEIAKVARVLNPYPPDSPLDPLIPATAQRTLALIRKEGDPEYARRYSQNVMDEMVRFEEVNGRPPGKNEAEDIMLRAGRQTNVDAWLRVAWNAGSPAPARPESKYAAIQMGWSRIQAQAEQQGEDFEWARERFVEKYGEIYMPLIYSTSNNVSDVTLSTQSVAQVKRHRNLLRTIDPALTRMVLGADGEGEYSPEARQWFKDAQMRPGDTATYLSDRNPREMLVEQVVRQGWSKYSALTGALTAEAQQAGLASYRDSEYLMGIRQAAIQELQNTNPLWWNDYNDFNPTDYDQYVEDMKQIASDSTLAGDTERQDVQALRAYLELRQMVVNELARRKKAGLPYTADANANQPMLAAYTQYVGALVEASPDFERFAFDGVIDRDPLLVGN